MRHQNSRVVDVLLQHPMTEVTDSRSGVENDALTSERDLDAARVAAKRDVRRGWTGDRPAHAPKLDLKAHDASSRHLKGGQSSFCRHVGPGGQEQRRLTPNRWRPAMWHGTGQNE